jgi:hypothetical protein
MEQFIDVTPDVDLLENLRSTGITNMAALGEFLDNSVDADARNVTVHIYNHEKYTNIMISDDGRGISETNIKGALTLAKSMKVGVDQLGKFGMGMKTAALSLTSNFEILTKISTGNIIYASYNINKMKQNQNFIIPLREAEEEEISLFNSKLNFPNSGTIILLKYCDKINAKSNQEFREEALRYIGQVYRRYIERGTVFTVKDDVESIGVPAIDPLMRKNPSTKFIADRELHSIKFIDNSSVKTSNIEISATVLPNDAKLGRYDLKMNQMNQGIYLLRQNREIAQALAYTNIWGQKHNSKNRIRFEIVVKPELDGVLRIDFNKGKGNPTTELKDQLERIIKPMLEECVRYIKSENGEAPPKPPKPIPGPGTGGTSQPTTTGGNSPISTPYPTPPIAPPTTPTLDPVQVVKVPKDPVEMNGAKYRIVEPVAVFAERDGYTLELNIISWGGKPPELDLRYWNHSTGVSTSGVSMSPKDVNNLKLVLTKLKFE